jgi:hypothetical protein
VEFARHRLFDASCRGRNGSKRLDDSTDAIKISFSRISEGNLLKNKETHSNSSHPKVFYESVAACCQLRHAALYFLLGLHQYASRMYMLPPSIEVGKNRTAAVVA